MTNNFFLNTTNILSLPLEDLNTFDLCFKEFITNGYNPLFAELEELFDCNPELTIQDQRVQELANKIEQFLYATDPSLIQQTNNLDANIGSKNSSSLAHLAFTLQALRNTKNLKEIIHGYSINDHKRIGLDERFSRQFFTDFNRMKAQVLDQKGNLIDSDIFGSIAKYHKLNEQIYKLNDFKNKNLGLDVKTKQAIIDALTEVTKEANHFSSLFPEISRENLQHINFIINSLQQNKSLEYIFQGDKKHKGIYTVFSSLLKEPKETTQFYLESLKTKLNLSNAQLSVIVSRFNQRNITGSEVSFGSDAGDHETSKNIFYVQTHNKQSYLEKIEHTATGHKITQGNNGLNSNDTDDYTIKMKHQQVSYTVDVTNLKEHKSSLNLPTQKTKEYISCKALNENAIYKVPEKLEGLLLDKQKRQDVQKIIQTLATRPEAFSAILDLAENPWIKLNPMTLGAIVSKFAGTRLELIKIANLSSTTKPIHAILLENGFLEELTSLKTNQVNDIIIEIFKHHFIKIELAKAGIEESQISSIIDNINLAIKLMSTLKDHPIIPQLSSNLSKIITTNAKLNETHAELEKQTLSQLQEQNIEELKNIALNIFAIKNTRQAGSTFILSSLNTFANIIDKNNLSKEKKEAIISLQTLNKKIANEKDLKIKNKLTKAKDGLVKQNNITPIDELTLLVTESLGLNDQVNLQSLVSSSESIIKTIMDQPAELSTIVKSADKIQKFFSSGKNLKDIAKQHSNDIANIVDAGIRILSKEEIIKAITNETLNKNLQLLNSKPDAILNFLDNAKSAIELMAQDSVASAITKNQNHLKNIVELALPSALAEDHKKHKTQEDITAQEAYLKRNKAFATEVIELFCENPGYFTNIAQTIINNPATETTVKSFLNYSQATEETKTEKFNMLIKQGLAVLNSQETEEAIFKGLDSVIDSAYQKPHLRKGLSFLKDDLILIKNTLLHEIMPNLLNYTKHAGNNDQVIDLLIEAKDIINAPSDSNITPVVDLNKLKSVTKKALQLYGNLQNSLDINKGIETNKIAFTNLIDKSLSLLNKSSIGLRLLKPLGINGEFVQKMLVKINTKEGLEAMEKCIEKQSITNILGLISATQSRSFILGHMTKSLASYMFSPKNKEKTWTKFVQENRNHQNCRSSE